MSLGANVDSTLIVTWPLPWWLLIVLGTLLASLIGWLYWTEASRSPRWLRIVLAGLRFSLLMLVLWMLAGWSWQRTRVERPELVIAIDVSESMTTPDGSRSPSRLGPTSTTRLDSAEQLLSLSRNSWSKLRDRYQIRSYAIAEDAMPMELFSSDFRWNPLQENIPPELLTTQSRLGDGLSQTIDRQAGRGTAAILFLSDGVTTSGISLIEAGQRANRSAIPIHTVALGREFLQPDLRVNHLLAESQVYLGDRVTVEAIVAASDIPKASARVRLVEVSNGKVHDEQTVSFSSSENQQTALLGFVPQEAGEIELRVEIQPLRNELNTTNNSETLKLDVQDRVLRVLMVFSQPSYEFRFLKHFLERSRQGEKEQGLNGYAATFELSSVLQESDADYIQQDSTAERFIPSDPEQLAQFDAFVFGPLDPNLIPRSTQQAIVQAVTHNGSGCIFLGASGNPVQRLAGFPLAVLLPIESASGSRPASRGFVFTSTRLGQSSLPLQLGSREDSPTPEQWPPLQSILQVDSIKPGAQVLADASSIDDGSTSPLMITQFAGAGRTSLLATDETYRWTSAYGSDSVHQRFWGQTLRWLCRGRLLASATSELKVEPKQARLGTPLRLQLQLATERELSSQAEVRIEATDGLQRDVTLTRVAGRAALYEANVDQLPAGDYRAVLAQPMLGTPLSTEFSVVAPPSEQANLRPDVEAMRQLAHVSGGKAYLQDEANAWFENLPPGRPVRLGNLPPDPIWNRNWVAILFISLITAEWLLRRHARLI